MCNQWAIHCCHNSGCDLWPLTFLVLLRPHSLPGVHGSPQVLPLQIRHTGCYCFLEEIKGKNLIPDNPIWRTQVTKLLLQSVLDRVRLSVWILPNVQKQMKSLSSLLTFSNSWSCLCIRVFHCSKSSGSAFWMSFRVPSVWMVPSFIAIICSK